MKFNEKCNYITQILDIFSKKSLSNFIKLYDKFDLIIASGIYRYAPTKQLKYNSAEFIYKNILKEEYPSLDSSVFDSLEKYNLSLEHGGETSQNLIKIFSLLDHIPDLSLFIHVNPIFCCPGLVSESLFKAVEKDINISSFSVSQSFQELS